jgi:hypothetical protein
LIVFIIAIICRARGHPGGLRGELGTIERCAGRVAERAIVAHRVGEHPHGIEERIHRDAPGAS